MGKILDKNFDDSANIAEYLLQHKALVNAKTHSYLKIPYQILNRLWHCVKNKNVIEYHLESKKTLDEVLNIFVRINNGGKPVEISDLLLSLATAQLKDFDVENEIIGIVNEINNIGGEKSFNVSNDFVLRAFLVLCNDDSGDKKSIKFSVENFKPKRMQKIRSEWDKMSAAIKSAVKLVNEFGFNQRHFASNNILIPLAHYIYLKDNDAAAYVNDKGKMIHWFISMTLKGIFRTNTDEQLNRLRNLLNKNHESFPLKELLGANDKTDKELADELINALMNTTYKNLKNVLMALTILYDGKKDLATVDVDHMFPKIKIKNLGEFAGQGIVDFEEFQTDYEKFCNALPNLQLLDSAENNKKRAKYFNVWIAEKSDAERSKYMTENFVPDIDFKLANFKNFIETRRKLIREKLEENLKAHGVIYSTLPICDLFIEGQENKIADAVKSTDGKIILTILYEKYAPSAYVYNKNYEKISINIKSAYKLIDEGRALKIFPKTFDGLAKDFEKLQKSMHFPDGKVRIMTGVDADNAQYFSVVQENFALARINFLMSVPLLKKSEFVLINHEEFLKLKNPVDDDIFMNKLREVLKSTSADKINDAFRKDAAKLVKAKTFSDGKYRIRTSISTDGTKNFTILQENFALARLYVETAAYLVNEDSAVLIDDEEFQALKNSAGKSIDGQELKIADAVTDADGKIILTILYEGDGPMAYVYDKNYKKVRLTGKFAYRLIDDGRAIKIPPDKFYAMKNKADDMAKRRERQFSNAAVTKNGKYMFYADHSGVVIAPDAPKWNPSFYVVNEDLLTPRISLDIMLQEIVPQNLFVEITKADVDEARKIAKTSGKAARLKFLNKCSLHGRPNHCK